MLVQFNYSRAYHEIHAFIYCVRILWEQPPFFISSLHFYSLLNITFCRPNWKEAKVHHYLISLSHCSDEFTASLFLYFSLHTHSVINGFCVAACLACLHVLTLYGWNHTYFPLAVCVFGKFKVSYLCSLSLKFLPCFYLVTVLKICQCFLLTFSWFFVFLVLLFTLSFYFCVHLLIYLPHFSV